MSYPKNPNTISASVSESHTMDLEKRGEMKAVSDSVSHSVMNAMEKFSIDDPFYKRCSVVIPTLEHVSVDGAKPIDNPKESNVPGLFDYGLRSVVQLDGDKHFVVVAEEQRTTMEQLVDHFERIGIPKNITRKNIVTVPFSQNEVQVTKAIKNSIHSVREAVRDTGVTHLHYFIYAEDLKHIAAELDFSIDRHDWLPGSMMDNNCIAHAVMDKKFRAMNRTPESGPRYFVPEGGVVYSMKQVMESFDYLKAQGFAEVQLRLPYGAAGEGLYRTSSRNEMEKWCKEDKKIMEYISENAQGIPVGDFVNCLHQVDHERYEEYLKNPRGLKIEGFLEAPEGGEKICMGIDMFIPEKGKCSITGFSQQLLENVTSHAGNRWSKDLWDPVIEEYAYAIAEELQHAGCTGPNNTDLLVIKNGAGKIESIAFMEINPRDSGQSHFNRLTRKITGTSNPENFCWEGFMCKKPSTMLMQDFERYLDREGIIFDPVKKEGVVILNWIPCGDGYGVKAMMYVIASSKERLAEISTKARL